MIDDDDEAAARYATAVPDTVMSVVAPSGEVPGLPAPLQQGALQAQWREPSSVLGSRDFARQPPPASSSRSSSSGTSPNTGGAYGALSSYPELGRASIVRGGMAAPPSQTDAPPPPSVEDEDIFGVLSALNDDRSAPLPHSVLDVSPPGRPTQPALPSASRGPALQAAGRSQRGLWQPSDDPQQNAAHPLSSSNTSAAATAGLSPRVAPARPSVQPGRTVPPVTRAISPTPHEPHVLLPMPPTRPSPLSGGALDVVAIARLRGAATSRRNNELASPALSAYTPARDAGSAGAYAPRSSSQFHSPGYTAPASTGGGGELAEDDVFDSIRSPYLSWKGSHPRLLVAQVPSPGSFGRGVHHPSLRSPQAVGGALGDTAGDLWGILYDDP